MEGSFPHGEKREKGLSRELCLLMVRMKILWMSFYDGDVLGFWDDPNEVVLLIVAFVFIWVCAHP
jgi:hypothetical protein